MTEALDAESWVEEFVSALLEHAGLDLGIEEISLDSEGSLNVELSGPDSSRAIGREGQTLDALQQLVSAAAIHRGLPGPRIVLDIEHYRERREQRVLEDARRLATEVLDTGKAQDVPPMNARERRLVHMVVAQMQGLATESIGEGESRFVRIVPAKR